MEEYFRNLTPWIFTQITEPMQCKVMKIVFLKHLNTGKIPIKYEENHSTKSHILLSRMNLCGYILYVLRIAVQNIYFYLFYLVWFLQLSYFQIPTTIHHKVTEPINMNLSLNVKWRLWFYYIHIYKTK